MTFVAPAQNLLLNGDFEEYWECPDYWDQLNRCKYVFNPCKISTPDYFNSCSNYISYFGYNIQPLHGQGFVAIVIGGAGISDSTNKLATYREYIQIKLSQPLKFGNEYKFSFFLKLRFTPNFNCFTTDRIGVKFVNEERVYDLYLWKILNADWENPKGNIFINDNNWQKIEGSYTANGGEEWMIIGNFHNTFDFPYFVLDSSSICISNGDEIYVFLDAIEVSEMLALPNVFTPNNDGINDLWHLNKIIDAGYIFKELHIYNRWGNEIYRKSDVFFGWDGNCDGLPCSEGIYFVTVLFEKNNSIKKISGYITLLR
ncbi:MAG: T9SS type B sorting domain-containing protein [Bacteroidetes bacterium]|nr:gliding motility-associated C-terminal domain-containing protein [Bacteroidota bacterium]MCL4816583.1 gliding motility-associated C-terminal domain-containing protein [Flavobacteriales bacterium]NOG94321.1 T9SS type B sorting domain-containing protein [Bacteroidota bacterium]WKZ75316.1 MAG: gliding motility-associated C-terminal domain-containing protein [Vicingaceae bacterium]GIK70659.1 MAG: hypothetical protein BroJett020_19540 [Bacteroidota bacterium]